MHNPVFILIAAGSMMFLVIGGLSLLAHYYTLNGIKSRTVGDDQQDIILGSEGKKDAVTALVDTDENNLVAKAKAEKYAKTIINAGDENYGQNQFFCDAAEGLLTSVILLIAEYLPPAKGWTAKQQTHKDNYKKEGNQADNGEVAHTFVVIKVSFRKSQKAHIRGMVIICSSINCV